MQKKTKKNYKMNENENRKTFKIILKSMYTIYIYVHTYVPIIS